MRGRYALVDRSDGYVIWTADQPETDAGVAFEVVSARQLCAEADPVMVDAGETVDWPGWVTL